MSDFDRGEIPKWFRGPVTNSERLNMGKTDEEIAAGIQQRIRDTQKLDKQWNVPYDEERDLGYDDLRDLFNDGGVTGWDTGYDPEDEPRRD